LERRGEGENLGPFLSPLIPSISHFFSFPPPPTQRWGLSKWKYLCGIFLQEWKTSTGPETFYEDGIPQSHGNYVDGYENGNWKVILTYKNN